MPAFDPSHDTDHLQLVSADKDHKSILPGFLFLQLAAVFAWTSNIAADAETYWLWTAPVLLGAGAVFLTRRALPLSLLTNTLLALLGSFLMTAGAIATQSVTMLTVPGMPTASFAMTQDTLLLARAFLVGFAGIIAIRELLLRKSPLLPGKWLAFLAASVCLAVFHGLGVASWFANSVLEREAIQFSGAGPWEFLMVYAGSALSLVLLTRLHDRQITYLWMDFTSSIQWQIKRAA